MQQVGGANQPSQSGNNHSKKGKLLTKRDVIGGAFLIIVVVGGLSGYYAFNHISERSARMQFWVGFMFSFAALVVIVIQVAIYWQQAEFMEQQADILEAQKEITDRLATTALRQFEITDRPWLSFKAEPAGALTFNDQGMRVSMKLTTRNVGHSVAVNTTINAKIVIPRTDIPVTPWDQVLAEQAEFCQAVKSNKSKVLSYALFPDDVYPQEVDFPMSSEQVEKGRFIDNRTVSGIYVVGCVDYQFAGHDRHHQTQFAWQLFGIEPQSDYAVSLEIGRDVPRDRLKMVKMFMGGDYAD